MQAPGVEGIQAFRQGLGDCPCLTSIEQDWEDVGPVEVHLGDHWRSTSNLIKSVDKNPMN